MRWWHSLILVATFVGTVWLRDANQEATTTAAQFWWGFACVLVFFTGTNYVIYSVVEHRMKPIREALKEMKGLTSTDRLGN